MTAAFPVWVLVLDYLMGVIMWTLIGRFGMSIFLREDTHFFFCPVLYPGYQPPAAPL